MLIKLLFLRAPQILLLLYLLIAPVQLQAQQQQRLIPSGSQQYYELVNKVSTVDLKHSRSSSAETSYTFKSLLKVNSVWNSAKEQLLQVYFLNSKVSAAPSGKAQEITNIPDRPFYVSLIDGGRPSKVIAHTSRDQSLLNLERGVASLLQIQYERGPLSEVDVSGRCTTFYDVKSTTRLEKIKTDCSHWDLRVSYRSEKALGVAQHSEERIQYELSAEGVLLKAASHETHRAALNAKPDVGSQVESLLLLQHVEEGAEAVKQLNYANLDEAIQSLLEWYRVFDIEADPDGAISEIKGSTLKQQIAAEVDALKDEHIGHESLAVTIAALLPLARITKEPEFVDILKAHQPLHGQLVDLLGAVQTIDAHLAIHKVFKYSVASDAVLLERYLQALAVGTHPERAIIDDLLQRVRDTQTPIENEKLRDALLLTVAALTRQSSFDVNDPLFLEVRQFLVNALQTDCKEKDDAAIACKTQYIRALQNLQDPQTIPALLSEALEALEPKVSVAAMQALQSFPVVHYSDANRKAFVQLFYQTKRRYDSSARTVALDILLAMKPSKQQLGQLLDYLASNDHHFEIKTYVLQKLSMLAEKCPRFRALLGDCLAERPHINNYNVIAQKGLTTVLSRQVSQTPAFNESLLSVQEIYQGVLKRGSVELLLHAGREETSTFKLGIFTSGLSPFVSDGDAQEDEADVDDSPVTAGMEIAVQGVLLRPLIFFTGQTELMGHVWSGTASEPTPAFQATTLLQDHEHYMILASGATVYLRVIGTRSVDLNGKVELSLWNRNAETEIQQNTGTAVVGSMVAGFTYARVEHQFTLTNEPKISLQANLDFYSGIKLCMQLQRPEMQLTHETTKSVTLRAGRPYSKRVRTRFTHKSPGRTLALNQKNNDMCNKIFN